MDQTLTIEFDGGSRGNPGPAGIGVVIRAADSTPIYTLGRCIGRATNNVAEYRALITGLEEALKLGARRAIVRGDSELIIRQMLGQYKVKHPDMRVLYDQAKALVARFDNVQITHNLRNKNELADKLVNLALDRKADVTDGDSVGGSRSGVGATSGGGEVISELDAPSPVATKAGDRFACGRCGCSIEVLTPSSIRPHQLKPFVCQCGSKMG